MQTSLLKVFELTKISITSEWAHTNTHPSLKKVDLAGRTPGMRRASRLQLKWSFLSGKSKRRIISCNYLAGEALILIEISRIIVWSICADSSSLPVWYQWGNGLFEGKQGALGFFFFFSGKLILLQTAQEKPVQISLRVSGVHFTFLLLSFDFLRSIKEGKATFWHLDSVMPRLQYSAARKPGSRKALLLNHCFIFLDTRRGIWIKLKMKRKNLAVACAQVCPWISAELVWKI